MSHRLGRTAAVEPALQEHHHHHHHHQQDQDQNKNQQEQKQKQQRQQHRHHQQQQQRQNQELKAPFESSHPEAFLTGMMLESMASVAGSSSFSSDPLEQVRGNHNKTQMESQQIPTNNRRTTAKPACPPPPPPPPILSNSRHAAITARQRTLQEKLPDVLASSRRLQHALAAAIHDFAPPPPPPPRPSESSIMVPPPPPASLKPLGIPLVIMNGVRLRAKLRMCACFAVRMDRTSEKLEFIDERMFDEIDMNDHADGVLKNKEKSFGHQGISGGIEDDQDVAMIEIGKRNAARKGMAFADEDLGKKFDRAGISAKEAQAASQYNLMNPKDGTVTERSLGFLPLAFSVSKPNSYDPVVRKGMRVRYIQRKTLALPMIKSAAGTVPFHKLAIHNIIAAGQTGHQDASCISLTKNIVITARADTHLQDGSSGTAVGCGESSRKAATKTLNAAAKKSPSEKLWPTFLVPDPTAMSGTFTHAICQQPDIHVISVLTMTLRDTSSLTEFSPTQRSQILWHFEVGLDQVDSLCMGHVQIDDNSYWKESRRDPRLQRLMEAEASVQNAKKGKERDRKKEEPWLFFGVRSQKTEKDKRQGRGGQWACFGAPMKECSLIANQNDTAWYGGGCDVEGHDVPTYMAGVRRIETRLSAGGINYLDLWPNANEWKGEGWAKVKHAMAHDSLAVSVVCAREGFMPE